MLYPIDDDGSHSVELEECKTKIWYDENGMYHRDDDKPAVIFVNGDREWYKHGLLHRGGNKPAIVYNKNYIAFYVDGNLHRENNAPAVVRFGEDCTKLNLPSEEYYLNGSKYDPKE